MRDFHLVIPSDCIASETEDANRYALEQMHRHLKAQICLAEEVQLTQEEV